MIVQAGGIWVTVLVPDYGAWLVGAALQGLGTAMVYPTLLAAVTDHSNPAWRAMPVSIGSTRCTGAGPTPFFACVRCALAVLFVIGGSLAPVVRTVCLGRRDSHADQGAVAAQFSSSTGAGTSPAAIRQGFRRIL